MKRFLHFNWSDNILILKNFAYLSVFCNSQRKVPSKSTLAEKFISWVDKHIWLHPYNRILVMNTCKNLDICWHLQWPVGISTLFCWVKEIILRLHTIWFHISDILGGGNSYSQNRLAVARSHGRMWVWIPSVGDFFEVMKCSLPLLCWWLYVC